MKPNILTRKQAMTVLNVKEKKLRKLMSDPTFPATKIESRWFIFGDKLQPWLEQKGKPQ